MASATESVKPTVSITKLVIEITTDRESHRYSVDEIPAGCAGDRAFQLTKHDAKKPGVYHVVHDHVHGLVVCDCPDFCYRREGKTAEPCKHGAALISLGLLAAPGVEPSPEPLRRARDVFGGGPDDPAPCRTCVTPAESDAEFIARLEARESTERTRIEATYPTVFQDEPFADESPELSDAAMFDADDAASDPSTWPTWCDDDTWCVGAAPTHGTHAEPALVPGVDTYAVTGPTLEDMRQNAAATLARPSLCRPTTPSRRTRSRWDRP